MSGAGRSAASARVGVRGRPHGERAVLRERLLGRRARHGPCERDGRRRRAGRGAGIWAGPGIAGPRGKKRRFGPTGLLCWVGLDWQRVWVFYFLSFFYFLFQTKLNLFEFKLEFEFNPSTQTNKTMHQHECNNKFKPRKNLITCEIKLN